MQIIEPTEKAFVFSAKEKETLMSAANILADLGEQMCVEKPIETFSYDYEKSVYTFDDIMDMSDYLNEIAAAETITERS